MTETIRRTDRVRASELVGRGWLNTGGEEVTLEDLRGKIVILDFWTFCCINCLHVLDEMRPLEERFSDVLVTVGVHSPKFDHEADPDALAAAVERYEIARPVLDDPHLTTWQAYSARAWPTLVVIDPEGYIAAHLAGEGHVAGLDSLVEELAAEHEAKGTLHRGDGPYVPPEPVSRTLRFPGTAVPVTRSLGAEDDAAAAGRFLVADTGNHRIVELDADLETVIRSWGGGPQDEAGAASDGGEKGHRDGPGAAALFTEPQGVAILPAEVAAQVGYDVVVADTVNHRLRGIDVAGDRVITVAGNGVQRLIDSDRVAQEQTAGVGSLGTDPLEVSLSSPWDVLWSPAAGTLIVAMAGTHQIVEFVPTTGELRVLAGTGLEGLTDGAADEAWFAQTSGLAVDAAGDVWIADSETSSLRVLRTAQDPRAPQVETIIGEGLFDFGFRDGDPSQARLQHPLGVAALPDGSVLVADTYNGAIRRYRGEHTAADGTTVPAEVSTVARGLKEPSDVLLDADGSTLLVVETNAHELVRVAIPEEFLTVDEGAMQSQRPSTDVAPGELTLTVGFSAPTGQKLDDRFGDPTQLKISSSPEELIVSGAGSSEGLTRTLQLDPSVDGGVLHITARAAACDGAPGEEIPMHAACHLYQQDWGIPVNLVEGAADTLQLDLRGVK
ncbi:redoxin domain-containing protein [Nesterenkonia halophila]|uniref:NHL domain-containing thioredoxin family protein n=1 Tax=Nesterenkonia halophila TaxID=302044 RepID=UPI0012910BC9|nr:NHL domain-containing thioredoxin family protein [Nesterenkonia halophila]